MVGKGFRFRALLFAGWIATGTVVAQDHPGTPSAEPEEPAIPEHLEEVEEVLRTLDEAGVPPTAEDIERFLVEEEAGRGGSGVPSSFTGSISYRLGHFQEEGLDHYGKISLALPWLRLRGRVREYRTGLKETAGSVELGTRSVEVRAGALGLSHGHGLLLGAPGRGSSLAADAGFRPAAERMVTWVGSDDPRTVTGFGGLGRAGGWRLRVIREAAGVEGDHGTGSRTLAQLALEQEEWKVALAGQYSEASTGASMAAGWRRGPLSGSLEVMAMTPARGIPPAGAAVLQMKWNPVRGSGVEALFGFSDLPAKPELSSRPAVLPGWDGAGAALRGYTRTGSGLALRGLVHLGRHLDRGASRRRHTKVLVDLQAVGKVHRVLELTFRIRRDTRRVWEWSERYPWQAPVISGTGHRTVFSVQAAYEEDRSRARLLLRSFSLESGPAGGRRSLIAFSGSRSLGRRWRSRVAWATAWGDPVDLVSAVSPFAGYVLPRHWGHWRSETVLGLEAVAGSVRLQAAASLRHPDTGDQAGPWITVWATAEIRW